jgi:murein DD-endopeptidase MepM/ murein hydrolase activator NlpD
LPQNNSQTGALGVKQKAPDVNLGAFGSEENKSARRQETIDSMKNNRAERYDQLKSEGKSTKEIREILQKEFANLSKVMGKENTVSSSVEEELNKDKAATAVVELKNQSKDIAEIQNKENKIQTEKLNNWMDKVYQFLKFEFVSNLAGMLGFVTRSTSNSGGNTSGSANLQPKLGSSGASTLSTETYSQPLSMPTPNLMEVASAEVNTSTAGSSKTDAVSPLPSGFNVITSPYGPRKNVPPGASTNHKAIDLGAPIGTPVSSILDGVVTGIDPVWGTVVVSHPNGMSSEYMHLNSFNVSKGQKVNKGDVLGSSGDKRNVKKLPKMAPHLHFALNKGGSKINPLPFLQSEAGFSPKYQTKDIERRALAAAGMQNVKTSAPAATPAAEGSLMGDLNKMVADKPENAEVSQQGFVSQMFEKTMSAGATAASSLASIVPDKYLPADMKAALEKTKNNKTSDWTTAAGQVTNDLSWRDASMGEDLSGLRLARASIEDVKTPAAISPDVKSNTPVEITAPPANTPTVAKTPVNNSQSQMSTLIAGFAQSMSSMQNMVASANTGQQATVPSSGPSIDDLSLQMLQKFFIND